MKSRAPIRTGLILIILLLLATLGILMVNLVPLLANGDALPRNVPTVRNIVTSQVNLVDAAARATERAQVWSEEAEMVQAKAAWVIPSVWKEYEIPPVAWTFYYYAPSTKNLAVVVIDDDTTLWVPPFEISIAPNILKTFPPPSEVDLAWLSFRGAGGDQFLEEHPQSQVNFHLKQQENALIWIVSAFDENDYLKVTINAETGVVVSQE